jgi:hypothetical protein
VRVGRILLLLLCLAATFAAVASGSGKFGLKGARAVQRPALVPGADRDRDGLDNATERRNTKTDPRKFDTDGDGFSDGAEVGAGTDPRDRSSVPAGPPAPPVTPPAPPVSEKPKAPAPPAEPTQPADTTAPQTTIDSGPAGTTTSPTASFQFRSSESGSSFQCRLDSGAWGACSSTKAYSALAVGSHSFAVKASDGSGNADASPATRSWTVQAVTAPPDTTAPQTTIGSGPAGTTTSTAASFQFSSSESGSSFQCQLDSGAWDACSSPKAYSSLAVGSHSFAVKASDAAGNTDVSPATRKWKVIEVEAPVDCTTNLSPGANVAEEISNADGGAVICLAQGDYGRIALSGAQKSPPVTLRSGDGVRATVDGIALTDPIGLHFVDLDIIDGATVTPSGSDIRFIDNEMTGTAGIYLFGDYRIGKQIDDVVIEGNEIHDIDYSGHQETGYGYGIEGVGDVQNMTIRGNTIQSPASDYIQSATPVNWVVDGNTFLGPSLLGSHEDHQDLWQIFGGGENITFTNNVARNTETQESLLFQEGAFTNVVIENNLFDHDSRGYTCQLYQSSGLVFRNNTIVGSHWGCLFRDLASSAPGSDYEVDHNVFAGTEASGDVSTEGRAGDWGVYDYNVSEDGSADGGHSVPNWSPSWSNTTDYVPLGLPFTAGFRP